MGLRNRKKNNQPAVAPVPVPVPEPDPVAEQPAPEPVPEPVPARPRRREPLRAAPEPATVGWGPEPDSGTNPEFTLDWGPREPGPRFPRAADNFNLWDRSEPDPETEPNLGSEVDSESVWADPNPTPEDWDDSEPDVPETEWAEPEPEPDLASEVDDEPVEPSAPALVGLISPDTTTWREAFARYGLREGPRPVLDDYTSSTYGRAELANPATLEEAQALFRLAPKAAQRLLEPALREYETWFQTSAHEPV